MATKTINDFPTASTVATDDKVGLWDASAGATYAAAKADFLAEVNTSLATLTASFASVSTQGAQVATRGIGTTSTNTRTTLTDFYSGDTGVAMNPGDKLVYSSTWLFTNTAPVTNKTSVVISTTSGSSTITATSGTFASTDTGRRIVATGIPVDTYVVFVGTTSATLMDADGNAVNATASGTGVTTVISSDNAGFTSLFKIAGVNSVQESISLAPTGTGFNYISNLWVEMTQGVDGTHHTQEGHWRTYAANATGSNSAAASGIYVEPSPSNRSLDLAWFVSSTTTDYGLTRQSMEERLTMAHKHPAWSMQRMTSSIFLTRA